MPGQQMPRRCWNGGAADAWTMALALMSRRNHWLCSCQTSLEHLASISEMKSFIVGVSFTQCVINTPSYWRQSSREGFQHDWLNFVLCIFFILFTFFGN